MKKNFYENNVYPQKLDGNEFFSVNPQNGMTPPIGIIPGQWNPEGYDTGETGDGTGGVKPVPNGQLQTIKTLLPPLGATGTKSGRKLFIIRNPNGQNQKPIISEPLPTQPTTPAVEENLIFGFPKNTVLIAGAVAVGGLALYFMSNGK